MSSSLSARQQQLPSPPSPSSRTPPRQSSSSAGHGFGLESSSTNISPVMRNVLRYTVSAREYAALHKYLLSRSRALRRAAPTPSAVARSMNPDTTAALVATSLSSPSPSPSSSSSSPPPPRDDYNAKAVRHALRVFVTTWMSFKGYEFILSKISDRRRKTSPKQHRHKQPFYKSPAFRLSLSLSSILFLYRLVFRFLARLRAHLLEPSVGPFRRRNPLTAAALTSSYAPAVGASFAGLALAFYPSSKTAAPGRAVVVIWLLFKTLEHVWDFCEGEGHIWGYYSSSSKNNNSSNNGSVNIDSNDTAADVSTIRKKRTRPWWFGSWLLQPLGFGQLLYATVLERDCISTSYVNFSLNNSPVYLHSRPDNYPANLKWPSQDEVFDCFAEMTRLNWPPFISPTMFPNKENVVPPTLAPVTPLTSQAHPLITSLWCATTHPHDPSCMRTYLTYWLRSVLPLARFFAFVHAANVIIPGLLSGGRRLRDPVLVLQRILSSTIRSALYVAGVLSFNWGSFCFFQNYLPRHVLPTQRIFLGGLLNAPWAWFGSGGAAGRAVTLYTVRPAAHSLWMVGVKRRWWRAVPAGDLAVTVLALMVTGIVYERDASAIKETSVRKGLSWVRGEGWRDWAALEDGDNDGKEEYKIE